MPKRIPRWTIPFLRALERTGEARAAAEDAGVDHSTAYARRRAHADFAGAWAEALERFEEAKKRAEEEEIAALKRDPSTIPSAGNGPPPRSGEDFTVVGGQVKRVSNERWGARKEAIFFDELAATNNVGRAAKAAGVSYNAVLARRLKHPLFAAKWEAVARTARATIGMHLLEETQKSFDPAEMNLSDVKPRVTIDQAIKISQIGASKAKQEEPEDYYQEMADNMAPDQVDEVKERILRKLQRLRQRDMPEQLAAGWSYDEEYDLMVPPGWVRAPPPEEAESSPE